MLHARGVRRLSLALPIVFAVHVLEEAPSFVSWFNSLVSPPISERLFLSVNATAFVVSVVIAFLVAADRNPFAAVIAVAWVSFLMLANGLFHLVATVAHDRYCPGVVTGTLLYLPFGLLFMRSVVRELRVQPSVVIAAALVGATPMLLHGYLIVFRGSRLF
jgi:hypothetical protein